MRLIDADALIADLEHDVAIDQDTLDYEDLIEINRANIQFDKDCKKNAIDLLKNAPTIEPERKKGEWIDDGFQEEWWGEQFTCSICGGTMIGISKYCPECGSEMMEVAK